MLAFPYHFASLTWTLSANASSPGKPSEALDPATTTTFEISPFPTLPSLLLFFTLGEDAERDTRVFGTDAEPIETTNVTLDGRGVAGPVVLPSWCPGARRLGWQVFAGWLVPDGTGA